MLIYLLSLSLIICCIELDISVPSFPDMVTYFGEPEGIIGLTVASNFLGFCLSSFLYGPLSDSFGRRKIMLVGNGLLTIGSIGCYFTPNIEFLIFIRFIQGLGSSTSAVVVFAILADMYKGDKYVKSIAFMNSLLTIAMSVAPMIGALVNDAIGWRGNYGVVALISVISWLSLYKFLPETNKKLKKFSIRTIMGDYIKLLFSGEFMAASFAPSMLCAAYFTFVACASFLYISELGLSLIEYGLYQGSILVCFSVLSLYAGQIAEYFGRVKSLKISIIIHAAGLAMMTIVSLYFSDNKYLITMGMIIFGWGFAILYPVIFGYSMEIFPDLSGTASSLTMGIRALLCSACTAYATHAFAGELFNVVQVQLILCIMSYPLIIFCMKRM